MDIKELLEWEERSWSAFWAEVERVPEAARNDDAALSGWSVHDLVWHCAKWADFCGEHFESVGAGSFADPFAAPSDEYWDSVNAEIANESKALPWSDVQGGAARGRARARAALIALPHVGEDAARWFGEETFVHYDEHAEHVRSFVEK